MTQYFDNLVTTFNQRRSSHMQQFTMPHRTVRRSSREPRQRLWRHDQLCTKARKMHHGLLLEEKQCRRTNSVRYDRNSYRLKLYFRNFSCNSAYLPGSNFRVLKLLPASSKKWMGSWSSHHKETIRNITSLQFRGGVRIWTYSPLSKSDVINYVAKYAAKEELKSASYDEILRTIL